MTRVPYSIFLRRAAPLFKHLNWAIKRAMLCGTNTAMAFTMPDPAPGFEKHPDYVVNISPQIGRLCVKLGETLVADSTRAVIVEETRHQPVWYIPLDDLKDTAIAPTDSTTYCPFKGHASYWSVTDGHIWVADAIWAYMTPYNECALLAGYASFYTTKVDVFVNGEQVR